MSSNLKKGDFFIFGGLAGLVLLFWSNQVADIEILSAWIGWSPIHWINTLTIPANFSRDFPQAIMIYDVSLSMHLYRLANALNISPDFFIFIFIIIEYVFMSASLIYLIRSIKPNASLLTQAIFTIVILSSSIRDFNLGSWAQVFYVGLYYNIADSFRLFGIALVIRRRYILASVALALSFMNHVVLGIAGIIFSFSMLYLRKDKWRQLLSPALILLSTTCLWFFFVIGINRITSAQFPEQLWHEVMMLFSVSSFPFQHRLFGTYFSQRFVPFLSFTILFFYYFKRSLQPNKEVDAQILSGTFSMYILVILGVIFSANLANATLIKLHLQRCNDLIATVGLVYIVTGLVNDILQESIWRRIVSIGLLCSPFFDYPPTWPLALSIPLILPLFFTQERRTPYDYIAMSLTIICLALLIFYGDTQAFSYWSKRVIESFFGKSNAHYSIYFIMLLTGGLFWFIKDDVFKLKVFTVFLGTMVVACSIYWSFSQRLYFGSNYPTQLAYFHAQLWARDNTKPTSLFMIDPSKAPGWRDYSRRSSFGTVREWLYSSSCYIGNYTIFQEGLQRLNDFKLDLYNYIGPHFTPSSMTALDNDVNKFYYNSDDNWRRYMADKYHVDYFVMEKRLMRGRCHLPVAYENEYYIIFSASESN